MKNLLHAFVFDRIITPISIRFIIEVTKTRLYRFSDVNTLRTMSARKALCTQVSLILSFVSDTYNAVIREDC